MPPRGKNEKAIFSYIKDILEVLYKDNINNKNVILFYTFLTVMCGRLFLYDTNYRDNKDDWQLIYLTWLFIIFSYQEDYLKIPLTILVRLCDNYYTEKDFLEAQLEIVCWKHFKLNFLSKEALDQMRFIKKFKKNSF